MSRDRVHDVSRHDMVPPVVVLLTGLYSNSLSELSRGLAKL